MKKLKKTLLVISAMAIAGSMAVAPVSAAISGSLEYIEVDENDYPTEIWESLSYKGIVVTMPDGVAPTVEDIGVECEITEYDAESMKIGYEGYWWSVSGTVEQKENQFCLKFNDEFSEDESIELSEKLVIRGVVEEAEVLYEHHISYGYVKVFDSQHQVFFNFKEGTDISVIDMLETYPEIEEMLSGYSSIKVTHDYCDENSVMLYLGLTDSEYVENDNRSFYNDILALEEVLVSKYDEFEDIRVWFTHLVSETPKNNAVYSIQPTWGDATNDDMIDIYDAVEIAKHVMNLNELDEDTVLLADINRDGETNLYDAIEISKTLMS